MRSETKYDVVWARSDGEIQECKALDLRTAFARLRSAIRTSGPITVHSIKSYVDASP